MYFLCKTMNSYIGHRGYTILKDEYSIQEIESIKKDLIVRPFVLNNYCNNDNEFYYIYRETNNKLFVPRYYGLTKFGSPHKGELLCYGEDINAEFNGKLRDYQEKIVNAYIEKVFNNTHGSGLIEIGCGKGKCLARDTKILMLDGTFKKVQDINVGDSLMGDDSRPRKVISLARGKEMMYKVSYDKCYNYIVNESHILCLKTINGNTLYLSVKEYLKLSNLIDLQNILFGYRVPIHFKEKKVVCNPFYIGHLLAYNNHYSSISTEFINFLLQNPHFKNNISYVKNILHNNRIPDEYKINSHTNLNLLLNGLLKACGCNNNNIFQLQLENKNHSYNLIEDIKFVLRVLGFHIELHYQNQYIKIIFYKKGDKLSYKKDILLYYIKIEKLQVDEYYGFEIDKNRCFVLEDFTVTHNTVCALNIISKIKKKTLVIVHKEFLLNQWKERIQQYLPSSRIGKIQGQIIDIENKDIVIAMLQSLSMKDYPLDIFRNFGFTIIDEVHHISSRVFSCALFKICTRYMLGLSATMNRLDKTTFVFKMFLGDVVYKDVEKSNENLIVHCVNYKVKDVEYNKLLYDFKGNVCIPKMINKITEYKPRTLFIVKYLIHLLEKNPKQQVMLISQYKNILHYIFEIIKKEHTYSIGYYIGGMKETQLKQSEDKQILLATYSMAAEGLDIKTLTTLIMVTPMTNIEQAVGRILRQKHEFSALVVDIVDSHSNFKNQWNKRKKYYKLNNYNIMYINDKLGVSSACSPQNANAENHFGEDNDCDYPERNEENEGNEENEENEENEGNNDTIRPSCHLPSILLYRGQHTSASQTSDPKLS